MATLRELIIKISANSQSFQTEISRASRMGQEYYRTMQNGGRQAANAARESEKALSDLTDGFASAGKAATAAAAAFATGKIVQIADEWNSVSARLKQASSSTDDFVVSQRQLMEISQRTGTAFTDNANLFARAAASMREYGYSSDQVLKITEAVSTGLKLSGASTAEAGSVITQFSQALAQGVLRGEEFNAVNESGDRVIRALAAGMGVARKDLKGMADDGKLTIDKVVPAIISQLETLQGEFSSLPQTVSGSMQKVTNSFMAWVGGVNQATGVTESLSGGLDGLAATLDSLTSSAVTGALSDVADNMSTITTVAGALVGVGLAKYLGGIVTSATGATSSLIAAAKSEVALAVAQDKGAQSSVSAARAELYRAQQAVQRSKSAEVQAAQQEKIAAAEAKVSAAQSRLTAALATGSAAEKVRARAALDRAQSGLVAAKNADVQAAAEKRLAAAQSAVSRNVANRVTTQNNLNSVTAVGTRLMGGALSLVGGVPGLVMLGAGAWYAMYQNQEQARQSAQEYARTISEVVQATKTMSLPESDDNRVKAVAALAEQNRLITEQQGKVDSLKKQIDDLNKSRNQPGITSENDLNIVKAMGILTDQLTVEENKLNAGRDRARTIQEGLEAIERRRNDLIREQAWRQNAVYQSLLMMNGKYTEFNRLLGLGNDLLMARQGLVNAPMRIPQASLDQKQTDALAKSRQDLELSKLKGEARERARLGYAADDLGLTVEPQFQTNRLAFINQGIEKWRNDEANKPKPKGPKSEEEKAEDVFKRINKQQREQIALTGQNTELAKIKYQISEGELTSLSDAKKLILQQNAALIDQKNTREKLQSFREGLADANSAARERGNIDFIGFGQGDEFRNRMKEFSDIRTEFLNQQRDLQRDFNRGEIPEDQYKQQTQALSDALEERLKIQEEYYEKLDQQRGDWAGGASDALADYAAEATNYAQIAADATSSILDSATSEIADGFKSMIDGSKSATEALSDTFAGFGEAVIDSLIKMGAQWLVYQAVQLLVGKTTQASAGSALLANAQAMAKMAELNAYASTAAIPIVGPMAAPAAAGAAAAFAEPMAAAIGALSLAGMAHDGIDKVPETGTWLLQRGERVVTASTSAKLDSTLEKVQQARQSTDGNRIEINIPINGNPDDRHIEMLRQSQKAAVKEALAESASQIRNGTGDLGRAMLTKYTGRRRG